LDDALDELEELEGLDDALDVALLAMTDRLTCGAGKASFQ